MDPLTAIGASLVVPSIGGIVEAATPRERVPYYRFGSARGLGDLYPQPEEPGSPFLGNMLNAVAGTIPGIISGQYAWASPDAGTEIESAYEGTTSLVNQPPSASAGSLELHPSLAEGHYSSGYREPTFSLPWESPAPPSFLSPQERLTMFGGW